jgi:hypothetical protein
VDANALVGLGDAGSFIFGPRGLGFDHSARVAAAEAGGVYFINEW